MTLDTLRSRARSSNKRAWRIATGVLLSFASIFVTGCATTDVADVGEGEDDPVYVPERAVAAATPVPETTAEPEVPAASIEAPASEAPILETRPSVEIHPPGELTEVVVASGPRDRHELIRDLVAEAQMRLRDVKLPYVFTGRGRREVLRGRPVAFALWSEAAKDWSIAQVEIPRPPVRWRPGGRPLRFIVRPPGITARHVKGTGAERLMFAFTRNGEPLKVYGRKYPVFDNALIKKRKWRAAVASARPIVYLPFTEDTLDPSFVSGGREFLLATARRAIAELRAARAPSRAFPGEWLADSVPAEVITTLAVIEQTDDGEYVRRKSAAVDEVLSQYGLKREDAYRYSVSRAQAVGPMQFTDRRGNGTYSLVVRSCREARLDPDFERGATNLLNAMKAAICLLDLELAQMAPEIRLAYRNNKKVLGIFPVAGYNGGPRNVTKLHRAIVRMGVNIDDLRAPGEQVEDAAVPCPCLWIADTSGARPLTIPKYNRENRWYVEKYQSILSVFDEGAMQTAVLGDAADRAPAAAARIN